MRWKSPTARSVPSSRTFWGMVLVAGVLAPGCGSRTKLWPGIPCDREGESQPCQGVCGEGIAVCRDGLWSECEVPPTQRPCSDVCGEGTQTCQDAVWSSCFVPPVEETCNNNCGQGVRYCVDRSWSECQVEPVERSCTYGCGDGTERCVDNVWGACDAPLPLPPVLSATIRDFRESHPDFEQNIAFNGVDAGIVLPDLGPDDKPVYAHDELGTVTTNGKRLFDQWYRDTVGNDGNPVNLSTQIELRLTPSSSEPDFYVYGNEIPGRDQFFPIDGALFGNEQNVHNYHFTLEASAEFVYQLGQEFRFNGDDDMWVFINRKLAIDLGGLHTARSGSAALDEIAEETGMIPGERYSLHIFFAERKSFDSNFFIETSIADVGQCR